MFWDASECPLTKERAACVVKTQKVQQEEWRKSPENAL